jgi:hypothetical protein
MQVEALFGPFLLHTVRDATTPGAAHLGADADDAEVRPAGRGDRSQYRAGFCDLDHAASELRRVWVKGVKALDHGRCLMSAAGANAG